MKQISERKRTQTTGRGKMAPFIGIDRRVLESAEFGALSGHAIKLLMELARQYKGRNNGDLSASWKQLKDRGWHSPGTLQRAKRELLETGFAIVTRQGGRNHCSLYALTFWPVHECNGKHDWPPETTALNLWKTDSVVPMRTNVVRMRTSEPDRDAA